MSQLQSKIAEYQWRPRCKYCGRFVKWEDIDNGLVYYTTEYEYHQTNNDIQEVEICYHKKCKEKE